VNSKRPTPVEAIELSHLKQAARLRNRPDRFSQLLGKLVKDEHHGQQLITTSGLRPEEHAELRKLADEAHAAFREELPERIAALRELLAQGDPLYILALVQASNLMAAWGSYYEPTHSGAEHKVELVASLLASQPLAQSLEPIPSQQMQQIHDELDEIVQLLFLVNFSMPRGDDLQAAETRFVGAMHWMTLRGTSYAHHGADLARAIYSAHADWMLTTLGFTVDDVLAMGSTIEELITTQVNALIGRAGAFAEEVLTQLDTPNGQAQLSKEQRAQLRSPEGRLQIGGSAFTHVFQGGIRDAATFSTDDVLAANPDLRREHVEAALAELSLQVGSLGPSEYTGLFDESPLREKPFLEVSGEYALPVPGMLLRETVTLLERRLMTDRPKFLHARAKTLDSLAVEHLGAMLPGAQTYTNLYYEDAELDGLVVFEDVALVVEGKGTALSPQAHRGDLERLRRDVGRAVEDAWKQGARAREFILRDDDSVFRDEAGTEITLPAGSVKEVFIVNPTLHELGGHAPQLGRLRALGLFPENELPWSVYINDLRVISETCENAAIFLHYLVWRNRLPLGEGVTVMDEIDLWACYLLCERFGSLASHGIVSIGNSSTDFDAYYAGLLGEGPKRDRPTKLLKEPVKAFVTRMATERPKGWRDAAGVCLDMSIPELAAVCAKTRDVCRDATHEGDLIGLKFGRVALIGIPLGSGFKGVNYKDLFDGDATLVVYCRETHSKRPQIVWAEYAKPVTFELSDYERAAFAAAETATTEPTSD
jgi:hypothetical protein